MITGWQIKTISRANNNQTIYEGALQSFVVDQVSYVSTPGRPGTRLAPQIPTTSLLYNRLVSKCHKQHEPVLDGQGEEVEDAGGQREDHQEALDHIAVQNLKLQQLEPGPRIRHFFQDLVAHLNSQCSWSLGSTNLRTHLQQVVNGK